MSEPIDSLDIGALHGELDALRTIAMAAGPGVGSVLLAHARSLLERMQALPTRPQPAADAIDTAAVATERWTALRLSPAIGVLEVDCMSTADDAATHLVGQWNGDSLASVSVRVGASTWSEQAAHAGTSRFATDGSLEGDADRRRFRDVASRAQAESDRWLREHPDTRWSCPRCAFQNAADATTCDLCGAPPSGSAALETLGWAGRAALPPGGRVSLPAGAEMSLPADWKDVLESAVDVAASHAGNAPGGVRVDVVLLAFDAARKVSLVKALVDSREALRLAPNGLAHATELASHLPAVVGAALAMADAAQMCEALAGAGARVELRPLQATDRAP